MSIEATVWALKYAPPMPPQLLGVLIGLADHADAAGRGAYPSVPTLAKYACKSERSVQRDVKALCEIGLVRPGDQRLAEHLPADKRPEVYDLATERVVPGGRAGDEQAQAELAAMTAARARGGRRSERGDAHVTAYGVTPTSPGDAHVIPRGDAHVASGVTPTSERGDAHVTQTTLEPPVEPKDSSAPAGAGSLGGALIFDLAGNEVTTRPAAEDLTAFGDFWLLYPKKRDRAAALKAWKAAVAAGADPARITEGARQYANERAGQDPKYTKYPATWLNKGCWDDEPDPQPAQLRAVAGGFQPFTCPPADAYANDQGF
ncbi:helix-turn-helix domain-containing protein [Streptomyces sp. NPDC020983]|uniref:helix-turn-helix domain-containing protein n=1 Tax=Streptomyces sp. NPDC020983 TaxID=3365106 RepID=UPI0037A9B5CE